mgnify:CR=1 FL=1
MKKYSIAKIEKMLRIIFLCLAVVVVAGVIMLIKVQSAMPYMQESIGQQEVEEYNWEKGLADAAYWLPENCSLYETLPDITFVDEMEQSHFISEWEGKNLVVVFWASWCGDCSRQMAQMSQYEKLAEKYGDVTFLYINKTDGSKETMETAREYFNTLSLKGELYFDISLRSYDTLGLHNIPTTLFLDKKGVIKAWSSSQIEKEGVFEALLKNALEGGAKATAEFVTKYMMDGDGGIHSSYVPGSQVNINSEVLSESQGLGLLYAVSVKDKELFDKILGYIKAFLWKEGLAAWRMEEGKTDSVNALIDDLRIYRALVGAEELWGGYASDVRLCGEALLERAVCDGKYVDFYDFQNRIYASRFTLCYGDMQAMQLLVERTGDLEAEKAYEKTLELLERGQISNEFPLYYSWYNYDKEQYEKDDLNTAEAMMTLLHLARQGKLKNNTIEWLRAQMAGEGLKMRYSVEGEVVSGYNQESTAVYAILVMIADEIEDDVLRAQALKKMEAMHIINTEFPYNGAYGMEDGSGITSFDQLMPMLAYRKLEE